MEKARSPLSFNQVRTFSCLWLDDLRDLTGTITLPYW